MACNGIERITIFKLYPVPLLVVIKLKYLHNVAGRFFFVAAMSLVMVLLVAPPTVFEAECWLRTMLEAHGLVSSMKPPSNDAGKTSNKCLQLHNIVSFIFLIPLPRFEPLRRQSLSLNLLYSIIQRVAHSFAEVNYQNL